MLDADKQFVTYVQLGVARKMMREKKAAMFRKAPFTVILPRGVVSVPELNWAASRRRNMTAQTQHPQDAAQTLYSYRQGNTWDEQIQAGQTEVWVANVSPLHLSLDIETLNGTSKPLLLPIGGDPINLADKGFNLETLRNSSDFKRLLSARFEDKPILKLMSEKAVMKHYEMAARENNWMDSRGNPDIGRAVLDAVERGKVIVKGEKSAAIQKREDGSYKFSPPRSLQELQSKLAEVNEVKERKDMPIRVEEVVNAKVIHICHQVSNHIPANDRWSEEKLNSELRSLWNLLKEDDFIYLESHGRYKSVKDKAHKRLRALYDAAEAATTETVEEHEGLRGQLGL